MKRFPGTLLLLLLLLASAAGAADAPSNLAGQVEAIKAGTWTGFAPYSRDVAFGYWADFAAFAKTLGAPLAAKPALVDGKVAKWLVPCLLKDGRAGAFFQFSAAGDLIAVPDFEADLRPGYAVARDAWEAAKSVNDLPDLVELIPIKLEYSAGIPIEPARVPGITMVSNFVGRLPFKSQEERFAWLARCNWKGVKDELLAAHLGRRTGTSKCLGFAASSVADYWTLATGNPLGAYTDFISGIKEYGTNPRLLETLYCLYRERYPKRFWFAPRGTDRVTGERIPWSIKAYVETLYNAKNVKVADRLNPKVAWAIGPEGFHMDLAPVRIFKGPTLGKREKIKDALKKFGPLLAQHTNRITDSLPIPLMGVHAVVLCGFFEKDGDDWFVYQESFGPNAAGYLEDSLGGPRYRAMPARLFYQAWGFPHTLRAEVSAGASGLVIRPLSHEGKPIPADSAVAVAGNRVIGRATANADGRLLLPAAGLPPTFNLVVSRAHFVPLMFQVTQANGQALCRPVDTATEYLRGYERLDSVFEQGDRAEE